jgi:hypothetical protein
MAMLNLTHGIRKHEQKHPNQLQQQQQQQKGAMAPAYNAWQQQDRYGDRQGQGVNRQGQGHWSYSAMVHQEQQRGGGGGGGYSGIMQRAVRIFVLFLLFCFICLPHEKRSSLRSCGVQHSIAVKLLSF